MNESITYVGMDVHKESIRVAMINPGQKELVEWSQKNSSVSLIKRLKRKATGTLFCCYEAGPCGYALQRGFEKVGIECLVVAPSLIPRKPGERIKTDRRDAKKLARYLRSGDLTEVHPPTTEEESVRDVCRAREDAKEDLLRSRHRLQKFLLRRGIIYSRGKRSWTRDHRTWLRSLCFTDKTDVLVFTDYLRMVEYLEERVQGWLEALTELSQQEPYATAVGYLRCFRGIDTVTAMTIVAELHGFMRFTSPRELLAYLGLVPGEHSSGETRRQGSITKTGNGHVRRVLVETAWHYRHVPAVSKLLKTRRKDQPEWVIATAEKAQRRLSRRYRRLINRGKPSNKAAVAVARELVGFLWAVMSLENHQQQERQRAA